MDYKYKANTIKSWNTQHNYTEIVIITNYRHFSVGLLFMFGLGESLPQAGNIQIDRSELFIQLHPLVAIHPTLDRIYKISYIIRMAGGVGH